MRFGIFTRVPYVFALGLVQVDELGLLVQNLPGVFRQVGETMFRMLAPWLLRLRATASNEEAEVGDAR